MHKFLHKPQNNEQILGKEQTEVTQRGRDRDRILRCVMELCVVVIAFLQIARQAAGPYVLGRP